MPRNLNPPGGNGASSPPLLLGADSQPISSSPELTRQLRAATSELARIKGWVDLGGRGFWDLLTATHKRNIWAECGYPTQLNIASYRSLFSRGGIAARIVDTYPLAAWPGVYVEEDEDPEVVTPFEESVSALADRLSLWSRLTRADVLRGIGHYSVLLLGAPGESGTEDSPQAILSSPLPKSSRPESTASPSDLLYVTPVAEDRATILELVDDPTSPRHGLPLYYEITLGGVDSYRSGAGGLGGLGLAGGPSLTRSTGTPYRVHYSRVVHIARGCLEDEILGEPELRAVWNYLWDLLKIVGGGAEAAWKRADPGQHMDIPGDEPLGADDVADLETQLDEYHHGLRRTIQTRDGTKFNLLTTQVSSFGGNADTLLKLIAGTKRIPVRKLVGSERGELASSQDDENWWDAVDDYRDDHCTPVLRRRGEGLLDRLIEFNYLAPPTEDYAIKWPARDEDTLDAQASVCMTFAQANQAQNNAGGRPIISSDEIRDLVLGKEPMEAEVEADNSREGESGGGSGGDRSADDDEDAEGSRRGLAEFTFTDSPPGDSAWQAVHEAADSNLDPLTATLAAYYPAVGEELSLSTLEDAATSLSHFTAQQEIDRALEVVRPLATEELAAQLNIVLNDGGLAASSVYQGRFLVKGLEVLAGEELLTEIGAGVFSGTVEGQLVEARQVVGPLRTGPYYEIYVNGELRSHTRTLAGAQSFAVTILAQKGLPKFAMDVTNPSSLSWARARAGELITEITSDTRLAIRSVVAEGFESGIPPRQLARTVKDYVGLRTDQVAAVRSLRDEMLAARPGTVITRFPPRAGVRKVAGFRAKVPTGDRDSWVRGQLARYRDMQHSYRARTIARTETMRASGEGQRELWRQNIDRGYLDKDQKRYWIVTPDERLREEHAAREGVQVGVLEEWPWGSEPGEEVNCRCAEGLVID